LTTIIDIYLHFQLSISNIEKTKTKYLHTSFFQ